MSEPCAIWAGRGSGLIKSRYMNELQVYYSLSAATETGVAAWEHTALAPTWGDTCCPFQDLIITELSHQTIWLV